MCVGGVRNSSRRLPLGGGAPKPPTVFRRFASARCAHRRQLRNAWCPPPAQREGLGEGLRSLPSSRRTTTRRAPRRRPLPGAPIAEASARDRAHEDRRSARRQGALPTRLDPPSHASRDLLAELLGAPTAPYHVRGAMKGATDRSDLLSAARRRRRACPQRRPFEPRPASGAHLGSFQPPSSWLSESMG